MTDRRAGPVRGFLVGSLVVLLLAGGRLEPIEHVARELIEDALYSQAM